MDIVRYRPGEAIRWLKTGAEDMRKQAKRMIGKASESDVKGSLKSAASAIYGYGKSAVAELVHRQLEASEYVLHEDRLEVIGATGARYYPYESFVEMRLKGDRCTVVTTKGKFVIKPHAYVVSGTLKVPVGWMRNDMEVAFEMLLDELSARAGVNIEHL